MSELKEKASKYITQRESTPLMDGAGRAQKARKIAAVLADCGVLPDHRANLLDLGCSAGLILKVLAPLVRLGVGVDLDASALNEPQADVVLARADAEHLPFAPASFQVVVCNHVYEHTDQAERLVAEIDRVLVPGGVCYFAGPNLLYPVEPHYRLPFLAWLPRPLADRYVRLMGRGRGYPEKLRTPAGIRQLLAAFEVTEYTQRVIDDPVRFHSEDMLFPGSLKHLMAKWLIRVAPFLAPDVILIARKAVRY